MNTKKMEMKNLYENNVTNKSKLRSLCQIIHEINGLLSCIVIYLFFFLFEHKTSRKIINIVITTYGN